jgi:ABC-2 type transport system ATP-binding protein
MDHKTNAPVEVQPAAWEVKEYPAKPVSTQSKGLGSWTQAPQETPLTGSPQDYLIWAKDLTKSFGDQLVVDSISFALKPGTIFGFIGPSGSGKTTTIRLLTGVYRPSAGELLVFNRSPRRFRPWDRARIGYMPQQFILYPDLTVWENMRFAAAIYGGRILVRRRTRELLEFVELYDDRHKLARDISGGMLRRLSLAATLIHDPELLVLDEPTASIDPVLRAKFWDYFRSLKASGRTQFITTQYVSEAAYCDLVGVMHAGRLIAVETPHQLRHRALGGEVVDLRTQERLEYHHLQQLLVLPFISGEIQRASDYEVRIIVDKASKAIPQLVEWTKSQGLTIESIHEYFPPFDEIFIKLIERQDHAA